MIKPDLKIIRYLYLYLFVGALVIMSVKSQLYSQEKYILMEQAYKLISTDRKEAIKLFEAAFKLDSTDFYIKRQLGYLYHQEGQNERALENFFITDYLFPSDTIKLQIAYLLNTLNRKEESLSYFRKLLNSSDFQIRQNAKKAEIILQHDLRGQKHPWWGNVYASTYYDTRFDGMFWFIRVQEGYYVGSKKYFSLFGIAEISGDSKSEKGIGYLAPHIFSDNVFILAAGLRINLSSQFSMKLQRGLGIDLIQNYSEKRVTSDFRFEMIYGNGIYPEISIPDKIKFTSKLFLDVYSSLGYYSRFDNGTGYGVIKLGARFIEFKTSSLDVYSRFNIARDAKGKYYNNLVEWGVGGRFIPDQLLGLSFAAEYHHGRYWRVSDQVLPYGLFYNSWRFFIILDRPI